MSFNQSRLIAKSILSTTNVKISLCYEDRIPQDVPIIVISNHRSFLDAPILIRSLPNPLRIACHHYMGQTPVMGQLVRLLGCFPLAPKSQRTKQFFTQAQELISSHQWVGLFPEGTTPMVKPTSPKQVGDFHRGFAHLAFQLSIPNLVVLPVAISSGDETIYPTIPIRWLRSFDRDEPLFNLDGLHPMVVYHRVNVLFGRPFYITPQMRKQYQGKKAKELATNLSDRCREEISNLLNK